ncbi:CHAP domain-containing protein [Sinosporangium album]|uniref:CHAP domain-containing protein n=1 Tax=Sinosporangium album TaxID=504805 RepID=A0A1G8ADQ9_9ACTN|nr:peptidoglycan-binding domain-containing protein [Sinosporangium album]SDH19058.1 CHAP domain-containing protein [Sinosporangium album]
MGTAERMIKVATGEVGYKEKGSNWSKYADQVQELSWAQNQPWCVTFLTWVAGKADCRDIVPITASCLTAVAWFRRQGRWSYAPRPGSWVFYGPLGSTHVELVVQVAEDRIKTIGGNTTGDIGDGNYANGDAVASKWVDRGSPRIYGYGHPDYDSPPAPAFKSNLKAGSKGNAVKVWQGRMRDRGWTIRVDGVYGPASADVCKKFQAEKRIPVSGVVDETTWLERFKG